MSNQPTLSKRAQQGLNILANGGEIVYRLETNKFTGRQQFQTRFCASKASGSVVKGLGFSTHREIERAGIKLCVSHRTSTATHYKLDNFA